MTVRNIIATKANKAAATKEIKVLKEELDDIKKMLAKGSKFRHGDPLHIAVQWRAESDLEQAEKERKRMDLQGEQRYTYFSYMWN